MSHHLIRMHTGALKVSQRVLSGEQVIYTAPTKEAAYSYARMMGSSRGMSEQVRVAPLAVNRRGCGIALPCTTI